jgi:hypothetical protein
MTLPYLARFLCLCLASFFLAHLALSTLLFFGAGIAVRKAGRMRPRTGAWLLFLLRLLPSLLTSFAVACLCVPSYLWLEPEVVSERVGAGCLVAALLGAAVLAGGAVRTARAAVRSSRYLRNCGAVVESDAPVLMLAGVFRSRLVVSRAIREALAPDQFDAAVRHEWAHQASRDNLKRMLFMLAPDPIPFVRSFRGVERGWARLAEWAADDLAVAGSRERSLALAAALVRVARMGAAAQATPLATSLLADTQDLSARVERLLEGRAGTGESHRSLWPGIVMAACGLAMLFRPATLYSVHRWLETLAR